MSVAPVFVPAEDPAVGHAGKAAEGPHAIDTHHHYVPPVLRAALSARRAEDADFAAQFFGVYGDFAAALDDVDGRLRAMDAAGIEVAVLAPPPPGAEVAPIPARATLARQVNDEVLALAARYPGRFVVALCLPMPDAAAAAAECRRVGAEADVRAVSLLAHLEGPALDGESQDALYAACVAEGLAVLLHPGMDAGPPPFADWRLATALIAPLSTTLAAARLALSGTLDRHPHLDVVVPHLGGVAPYLLQRLEDQSSPGDAAHPLSYYFAERFYLDSCSFHPPALACARASIGARRILLGSDYPFRGPLARAVADLENLAEDEREAVARVSAERWFAPRSHR